MDEPKNIYPRGGLPRQTEMPGHTPPQPLPEEKEKKPEKSLLRRALPWIVGALGTAVVFGLVMRTVNNGKGGDVKGKKDGAKKAAANNTKTPNNKSPSVSKKKNEKKKGRKWGNKLAIAVFSLASIFGLKSHTTPIDARSDDKKDKPVPAKVVDGENAALNIDHDIDGLFDEIINSLAAYENAVTQNISTVQATIANSSRTKSEKEIKINDENLERHQNLFTLLEEAKESVKSANKEYKSSNELEHTIAILGTAMSSLSKYCEDNTTRSGQYKGDRSVQITLSKLTNLKRALEDERGVATSTKWSDREDGRGNATQQRTK